ncbi:YigZ family protein [Anaerofustis sp.]|uniref:YigZ family protein n=1 Tax=Anaerofustis sp. TaxID=1872517 RepID=UPI0025C5EBDA|nr:YigZ family protein [Anaerofustis sp.]
MDYVTVNDNFENTIEIKKSTFIAHLHPVSTVEDTDDILEKIRKEHYKATHNCYAYIIGENKEIKKASDDGEPSTTAGRPILGAIENNNLTNVLIVVTRYFGGVKLGANGLIRAYSSAAREVIKKSKLVKKVMTDLLELNYDYSLHGKIETFLRKTECRLDDVTFTDKVSYKVYVPVSLREKLEENLTALTNARISIINKGNVYIDEYL